MVLLRLQQNQDRNLAVVWVVPVISNNVGIIDVLEISLEYLFVSQSTCGADDGSTISFSVPWTGSSQYQNWGLFRTLYHGSVRTGSSILGF